MTDFPSGLEASTPQTAPGWSSTFSFGPHGAYWHLLRYRISDWDVWFVPLALAFGTLVFQARFLAQATFLTSEFLSGLAGAALVVAGAGFRRQLLRRKLASGFSTIAKRESELEQRIYSTRERTKPDTLHLLDFHIQDIVDTAAAIASKETGTGCAVAVKLLCLPSPNSSLPNEPLISTVVRDSKSALERANSPNRFPYTKNTAFEKIVQKNKPNAYYCCADLLEAERLGQYKNINENWRTQYNSTLVLAIADPTMGLSARVYGFLCLDSWAGDLTRPAIRHLMLAFTGQLYRALEMLSVSQHDESLTDVG
jgi:hypothetical protein